MVESGLIIMVLGMLVVFAFLAIMVIFMRLMTGIIFQFFPEKAEQVHQKTAASIDAELAVAIAAAHSIIGKT